ncbi:MFS transporter [Cellulomonas fimi]|uniref:MFS transporter n=1 Tax=Cellulomonas fimi TaxID=1708 RepID=UPI00234D3E7B|nr:MFS transporter [Cellulomonas fimi]MDC7122783.1 MFS transporter [Cellulomonas fimi]
MDTTGRLPWPSLLVLGGATFVMVTGEMLPTAVLPAMSADLDVPQARTGLLVSLWAFTVVVATFPLVRLTARFDRRAVVAAALVVFAGSAALTALAPTYSVAAGARVAGAAATGLLWAAVNTHTADLVAPSHLARAIAVVLGGATLGTVLGTPLANVVARAWDWRGAFVALAVLAVVAAALVRAMVLPAGAPVQGGRAADAREGADGAGGADGAAGADDGRGAEGRAGDGSGAGVAGVGAASRPSLRPVLVVAALVGLVLVGHFAAFTFVTRLVEQPAAHLPGGVSGLLLLFGVASAVGVAVVGRVGDRRPGATLVVTTVLVAASLVALLAVGAHPAVAVLVVAAWGLTTGALPPLAQTAILRAAGPEHRATAGTVIPVVFNLGIAVGAALGAAVVDRAGPAALPVPAAAVVLVAALALSAAGRPRRVATTSAADVENRETAPFPG